MKLALMLAPWHRLGLHILPQEGAWPLAVAAGIGLVFGVWMALADAFLFRPIVPAAQTTFVRATSALDRIATGVPLAVLDEIEFRWLLLSTVLWFVTPQARAHAAGRGPRAWAAMVSGPIPCAGSRRSPSRCHGARMRAGFIDFCSTSSSLPRKRL